MELYEHQKDAIKLLDSGKVLYGGVGNGKTATAIGYYAEKENSRPLIVITTAKKRDSLDWEGEAAKFGISVDPALSKYGQSITVDSWNNVVKYVHVKDAFFIFDEQRVVGTGAWVKAFLKIAKANRWILLSATPGDNWLDYAPIFIANGWYKNATQFKQQHVVYAPFVNFPKVLRYENEGRLMAYRNSVLVEMPYRKHTTRMVNYIPVAYNKAKMETAVKQRWNPFTEAPMQDVSELFRVMRQINNEDPSRLAMIKKLLETHDRLIIFYNFNYELEILRTLSEVVETAEYNGKKKEEIPESGKWVYLVQYTAGAEGWNCVATDAMVMYSLTYSYKVFHQSQGRIDRMNTPHSTLFYYILVSDAHIDLAVQKALKNKKNFNERDFGVEFASEGSPDA